MGSRAHAVGARGCGADTAAQREGLLEYAHRREEPDARSVLVGETARVDCRLGQSSLTFDRVNVILA